MLCLLLALQLASVEGRGEQPPEVSALVRGQTRVQASVHLIGSFALGAGAVGAGPGASGTLGAMVSDRFAVVARATIATTGYLLAFSGGGSAELVLSDHWSLGLGLALAFHGATALDAPVAWSLLVPARVSFTPTARDPREVARRGVQVFFELAPGGALGVTSSGGFGLLPHPQPISPFVFMASLGVGYAWW